MLELNSLPCLIISALLSASLTASSLALFLDLCFFEGLRDCLNYSNKVNNLHVTIVRFDVNLLHILLAFKLQFASSDSRIFCHAYAKGVLNRRGKSCD